MGIVMTICMLSSLCANVICLAAGYAFECSSCMLAIAFPAQEPIQKQSRRDFQLQTRHGVEMGSAVVILKELWRAAD